MRNLIRFLLAALLLSTVQGAYAQVPAYSSYPSASAVIFLDFDGHHIPAASNWNGGSPFTVGASNLSEAAITEVFNRVAEDYRPFNINITTDSTLYWLAPPTRRMRVVLTVSSEWYGAAGGVAWTRSFRWGDNTPCFVFTALLNYKPKNIGEAASHEAGHTLGLRHQSSFDNACNRITEYNSGSGDGEIGWAPIMGVGYYRNFTVWHSGTSQYGCSYIQSDLDLITDPGNGFGYRTDDHGSSINNATAVSLVSNQFNVSGVVERTADKDVFQVVLPRRGHLLLNAIPYNVGTGNSGSDLDLQVDLTDASQNVLSSYNPGTALSSFADTILDAGVYYLVIDGQGNQYASDYGSLGSYSIQGTFLDMTLLPLRQLELKGSLSGNRHRLEWLIDADERVTAQELQVSADGRTYRPVVQPNSSQRNFLYTPSAAGALAYRLKVDFENGKSYLSNVITLRSQSVSKPVLQGNGGNTLVISSPSAYNYLIVDHSGRQVLKGMLKAGMNTIEAGSFASGIYVIQFSNGNEQHVERFLKR
jgi:hypothetical protein